MDHSDDVARIAQLREAHDGTLPGVAFPGGYSILYLCADGDTLCAGPECANGPDAVRADTSYPAWLIVAQYVHWEGPPESCSHCGKELLSEYGDPDA